MELISFAASLVEGEVLLTWETSYEENNYGFEIQRSIDGLTWRRIGFVSPTSLGATNSYTWTDVSPPPALLLQYRLRQTDFDGRFTYSPVISVSRDAVSGYRIIALYPQPATSSVVIQYSLSEASILDISVFNTAGTLVLRRKGFKFESAGQHSQLLSIGSLKSGVYSLHLTTRSGTVVHPLIVRQ